MKEIVKIKKWQLIRYRGSAIDADLSASDFVTVGKRACKGSMAEAMVLPSATSALKSEAFYRCSRLKRVTLPPANNVGLSYGVFRGCDRLHEVENSEMLSAIGESAFEGCVMLRAIRFGRDLHRIGENAFRGCRSLTSVELPFGVEQLGRGAFRDCTELETVQAESLRVSSAELFRGCISLREAPMPAAWSALPDGIYRECSALREVNVPPNIREIGSHAFDGCTRLSVLTLSLGVERIGAYAFANLPNLNEVLIPHSVKRLGYGAFGTGRRPADERIRLLVENDYMARRLKRMLFWCGSLGCATVSVIGKTIEERKRERRRKSLDSEPVHLVDFNDPD